LDCRYGTLIMNNPFDYVTQQLDLITVLLNKVDIHISSFASQGILLALVVIFLAVQRKSFWPPNTAKRKTACLLAAPISLVAVAIMGSWGALLLNPPEKQVIKGTISSQEDLSSISIELATVGREGMSKKPPIIDLQTKEFQGFYDFSISHYPRSIEVKKAGCKTDSTPVSLSQLRNNFEFRIHFICEEPI